MTEHCCVISPAGDDQRNIESHRYWIRKKMGLGSEVNLSTFLAGM